MWKRFARTADHLPPNQHNRQRRRLRFFPLRIHRENIPPNILKIFRFARRFALTGSDIVTTSVYFARTRISVNHRRSISDIACIRHSPYKQLKAETKQKTKKNGRHRQEQIRTAVISSENLHRLTYCRRSMVTISTIHHWLQMHINIHGIEQ